MTTKYVIELSDDVQFVAKVGVTASGNAYSLGEYKADLEELNSDYINEHYSYLQDTAYQKGFEDGKAVHERGCEGCKYSGTPQGDSPCFNCSNYYQNNWTAKDDKIEVGDEVEVLNSGSKYLIAWIAGTSICGFAHDGVTCRLQPSDVRKTGRHFDIASILEDMRNG